MYITNSNFISVFLLTVWLSTITSGSFCQPEPLTPIETLKASLFLLNRVPEFPIDLLDSMRQFTTLPENLSSFRPIYFIVDKLPLFPANLIDQLVDLVPVVESENNLRSALTFLENQPELPLEIVTHIHQFVPVPDLPEVTVSEYEWFEL